MKPGLQGLSGLRQQLMPLAMIVVLIEGASAQTKAEPAAEAWQFGVVVDVAVTSRERALGEREQGLALGHSDLVASGPLGRHLEALLGVSVHSHEEKIEGELEEAWVQTRTLPAGFQMRLGRFLSQIGYLNEQHPHADDFVERPLLYRAFLGGHWFDDGVRLNWTAPTDLYLRLGLEAFNGKHLIEETLSDRRPGILTGTLKMGGDIGVSQSWQMGASYVHNRREALQEAEHESEGEEGHDEHGHDHAHAHGAQFSGKRMWLLDAAWKWAPDGNNREQQLKLVAEYARITDLNRFAVSSDRHEAFSLMGVWRFRPDWEVGLRTDWLEARAPHEDHFHNARLREHALMLAWKPTHQQTLRLQLSRQEDAQGVEHPARHAIQLQYVLGFGAHGAHAY